MGKHGRKRDGMQCSAYGCKKRRKRITDKEDRHYIRSDSEGSDDDESALKRRFPRTFHSFPADLTLRRQWVSNVHRKGWEPTRHSQLCSDHFLEEDIKRTSRRIRLQQNVAPTRFKAFPKALRQEIAARRPPPPVQEPMVPVAARRPPPPVQEPMPEPEVEAEPVERVPPDPNRGLLNDHCYHTTPEKELLLKRYGKRIAHMSKFNTVSLETEAVWTKVSQKKERNVIRSVWSCKMVAYAW